jgi:hypothetical protein
MADTIDNKWQAHPALSRLVRVAVVVIPFVTAMSVAFVLSSRLPLAGSTPMGAARWIVIIALSTIAMTIVDRLGRRLLPLSTLLNLTLLFPDQAPSRFRVAMRTGTTKQLRQKLEAAQTSALDETPSQAAERLLELVGLLSQHDRLTRGHSERVRAYTHLVGEEMGLTETELDKIRWAGLLHDVGKTAVATEILNKPGRLTDDEFEQIKQHPMAGRELVAPLADWLGESLRAVWEHHERFDGRGYPQGLAGTEISIAARIVSVADAYDVMTSARSYKKAMSATAARAELAANSGSQFDPIVVRAFLNISLGRLRLMTGPVAWVAQLALFEPTGVVHAGQVTTSTTSGGAGVAGSAGSSVAATSASTGVSAVAAKSGIAVGATASSGAATAGAVGASGFAASTAAVAVGVAAGAAGFAVAEPPAPVEFAETEIAADEVVNVVDLDDPSSMEIDPATGMLRRVLASNAEGTPNAAADDGSTGATIDSTTDGELLSKSLSLSTDEVADPDGSSEAETDDAPDDAAGIDGSSGDASDDTTAGTADQAGGGDDTSTPSTEPVNDESSVPPSTAPSTPGTTVAPVTTTVTPSTTVPSPSTTVPEATTTTTTTTVPQTTTTVPQTTTTVPQTTTTVPQTTTTVPQTTTTTEPAYVESARVYLGALLGINSVQQAVHLLSGGTPPSVGLPNYDIDKDDAPGRLVQKDAAGIGGSHPDKVVVFTAWRSADITGRAHLELYAAAKDFERKDITIEAGLYRCPVLQPCALLDSDTVEFRNANDFRKKTLHFDDVATALHFGDRIEVRIAVTDASDDDAWIAFGTSTYDSHLRFVGPPPR